MSGVGAAGAAGGAGAAGAARGDQRFEELRGLPDHSAELAELVGREAGAPSLSWDAVNLPMIRHWVEAMGDENPVYLSDEAAQAAGYDRLIAPPSMLQAWIMRGLKASNEVEAARAAGTSQGEGLSDRMMKLLDDEGLTSVVATNCEQRYERPLVVGDRLLVRSVIESISEPKRTALGTGRFLTTRQDYVAVPDSMVPAGAGGGARASGGGSGVSGGSGASGGSGGSGGGRLTDDQVQALFDAGEPVATMRFRILKFLPPARTGSSSSGTGSSAGSERPPRPRPALTEDNTFWFEGARGHSLLIQRCASCGTLRHPPLPACAVCRSLEWDTVEASGKGTLYSYVVVHYPQVPSFEYPLPIGLIELAEGTRVVANLDGMARDDIRIGMPLQATFVDFDEGLSLPVFVPAERDGAGANA